MSQETSSKRQEKKAKKAEKDTFVDKSKQRYQSKDHARDLNSFFNAIDRITAHLIRNYDDEASVIRKFQLQNLNNHKEFYRYLQSIDCVCKERLHVLKGIQKRLYFVKGIDVLSSEKTSEVILAGKDLLDNADALREADKKIPEPITCQKQWKMDFNQTKNTSKATGYQHCVIILALVVIAFVLLNVVHNLKEVSALSAIYHITMIAATGIFGIVSEKYLQEKKNKLVDLLQVIEADLSGLKEATNKYNVLLEDETMNLMKSLKSTLFLVDRNPEDSKEIKQVELETEGSMDHCKKLIDVYQQISKRAHNSCILIKKVVLENQ